MKQINTEAKILFPEPCIIPEEFIQCKQIQIPKMCAYYVIFGFLLFLNCIPYIQQRERINLFRVAIVCGVDAAVIGGFKDNKFYEGYPVTLNDVFPLYFKSKGGKVIVNGVPYRGNLEIKKFGEQIWVINAVNIEDYLKGVVPCEIGQITKNLLESAKAQTVAARTYAYAHYDQYQELGFDLYATIQDQVYAGINAEDELINIAIKKTRGEILTYHGRSIEAKYHSTCGGRTADFNDAWPGIAPAYLRSVKCDYCQDSPHYTWTKVLDRNSFFQNLRSRLAKIDINLTEKEFIKGFRLIKNPVSRHVVKVILETTTNEYPIETYNVRTLLGDFNDPGGLLKSNYLTIKAKGDSIIIDGQGYGHGVGMCQFGAIGMARKGKNYKQILYHYYPGTKVIHK